MDLNLTVKDMLRSNEKRSDSRSSAIIGSTVKKEAPATIINPYQPHDTMRGAVLIQDNVGELSRSANTNLFTRRAKTPFTGPQLNASCELDSVRDRSRLSETYSSLKVTPNRPEAGHLSVQDYVRSSFRRYNQPQSHLNYHPTERALQVSVFSWKNQGPKKSFIEPIIQFEQKKGTDPCKYSTQLSWAKELLNPCKQGHDKKGVFQPHERPLVTSEHIESA